MTFFDYISGMCNCLFSFIIFATLGSLCHAKTFCILPILARMNVLQNIYFCGTQKKYVTFQIFCKYIHNTKYMWNNYSTTWSSGEPEVLCRTATTPMYLDLLFWILHRLIQNKSFVWRTIFENLSFDKISNIFRKVRLLSQT